MKPTEKTLHQLRLELKQKDAELRQKDEMIREQDEIIRRHESLWDASVLSRGGPAHYMHTQQTLRDMLTDNDLLEPVTSFDLDQFAHIYKDFEMATKEAKKAPLFADDNKPNPGNRCRLDRSQVLLLTMIRKRRGNTQCSLRPCSE